MKEFRNIKYNLEEKELLFDLVFWDGLGRKKNVGVNIQWEGMEKEDKEKGVFQVREDFMGKGMESDVYIVQCVYYFGRNIRLKYRNQ